MAVDGISFEIRSGEIFGLLGPPNGRRQNNHNQDALYPPGSHIGGPREWPDTTSCANLQKFADPWEQSSPANAVSTGN